jgi:hypothetical protein
MFRTPTITWSTFSLSLTDASTWEARTSLAESRLSPLGAQATDLFLERKSASSAFQSNRLSVRITKSRPGSHGAQGLFSNTAARDPWRWPLRLEPSSLSRSQSRAHSEQEKLPWRLGCTAACVGRLEIGSPDNYVSMSGQHKSANTPLVHDAFK